MKKILLIFLALLFVNIGRSQRQCGTDEVNAALLQNDPEYAQRMAESIKNWIEYQKKQERRTEKLVVDGSDTIYEIPIVIHVMHTGDTIGSRYNKSKADIEAWIDYTNKILEGTATGYIGADSIGTRLPFKLVLATANECVSSDAILRHDMSSNSKYVDSGIKRNIGGIFENVIFDKSRWNAQYYYNIYLVNKIDGWDMYSAGSGVVGWAYFPGSDNSVYGTVMLSATVSTNDNTFAHEFGHSLGLYHTFQGGGLSTCPPAETSCSAAGDYVCDTEPHYYTWGPCASNDDINPCTGTYYANTQYNVMSYGACSKMFTPGQRERAVYMMNILRSDLMIANHAKVLRSNDTISSVSCFPTDWLETGLDADGVYTFTLGNINSSTGGSNQDGFVYKDFTKDTCYILSTTNYIHKGKIGDTINYSVGIYGYDQYIKLYIDFNGDGIFDEINELVDDFDGIQNSIGNHSGSFVIPEGTSIGEVLRVRVMSDWGDLSDACSTPIYGQVEDYGLLVSNPLSINGVNFNVSSVSCNHSLELKIRDDHHYTIAQIEYSTDGKMFHNLTSINLSASQSVYNYVNTLPVSHKLYYRIKLVDGNGAVSYTEVKTVNTKCITKVLVYPVPSTGKLNIELNTKQPEDVQVQVLDVVGRIVYSNKFSMKTATSKYEIDLTHLPSSSYMIQVHSNTLQHQQRIMIK